MKTVRKYDLIDTCNYCLSKSRRKGNQEALEIVTFLKMDIKHNLMTMTVYWNP